MALSIFFFSLKQQIQFIKDIRLSLALPSPSLTINISPKDKAQISLRCTPIPLCREGVFSVKYKFSVKDLEFKLCFRNNIPDFQNKTIATRTPWPT